MLSVCVSVMSVYQSMCSISHIIDAIDADDMKSKVLYALQALIVHPQDQCMLQLLVRAKSTVM